MLIFMNSWNHFLRYKWNFSYCFICVYFQFFLRNEDIGKNRVEACLQHLAELNTYVPVAPYSGPLSKDFLLKFKVRMFINPFSEWLCEELVVSEVSRSLPSVLFFLKNELAQYIALVAVTWAAFHSHFQRRKRREKTTTCSFCLTAHRHNLKVLP